MEKEIISLAGGKMNSDDDLDFMPMGDSRPDGRNDIVYPTGDVNTIESRRILTLITHTLPSGTNKVIGKCYDVEHNATIYFVCNSANNDCIVRVYSDNSFQNILILKIGDLTYHIGFIMQE
jgi:hypothetical protein